VVNGRVCDIVETVKSHKIASPALLIFGEGAAFAAQAIESEGNWAEKQVVA
jgi:hypothetical protein